MSGDYLWSGRGPRDPEVARLERMLGTMRPPALPPLEPATSPGRMSRAGLVIAVTTAAALVVLTVLMWRQPPPGAPVPVLRLAGEPVVNGRVVPTNGWLRVGQWIETDGAGRLRVDLTGIGGFELAPNSRLQLVSSGPGRYRVFLARGTLRAGIFAPPGRFVIDTVTSSAADLGCAFEVSTDGSGAGILRVTSGWAGYRAPEREAFVPAGAVCVTRRGLGPGTPHFENRSAQFLRAIETIDTERDPDLVRQAIDRVVTEAGPDDAVTLWHLLSRVGDTQCDRLFDRLASYAPAPAGVTRDGVRARDRVMLARWWAEVRPDSAHWWPAWQALWPDPPARR